MARRKGIKMTKTEFLKEFDLLVEGGQDFIFVSVSNPNMINFERIGFNETDYEYKRKFYNEAYDENMCHVMNNAIKIVGIC